MVRYTNTEIIQLHILYSLIIYYELPSIGILEVVLQLDLATDIVILNIFALLLNWSRSA